MFMLRRVVESEVIMVSLELAGENDIRFSQRRKKKSTKRKIREGGESFEYDVMVDFYYRSMM